jgi:TolB-like protein
MIKSMTLVLSLVLGCILLTSCSDIGDPAVRLAMARADVKKIDEESARETAKHQKLITKLENETEISQLLKESKVQLAPHTNIMNLNYNAADSLLAKLKRGYFALSKDAPILVASFVDLDNLNESSTFGRVVSEQIASRFNQRGYATIEMKLRTDVFIREGSGELLLSREVAEISDKHRAQAVVVGTYAVASNKVYLTARVVNVSDGRVLSSYDYDIPITCDVFKMLLKGRSKTGWL